MSLVCLWAELVAKALPPIDESDQSSLALFSLRGRRLIVNMRSVLVRLFRDSEFIKQFEPGEDSGFIRGRGPPPRGSMARVGGRLLHGTQAATAKNLERLHRGISELLDDALHGVEPVSLSLGSLDEALEKMAESLQERKPFIPSTASLVPVVFAPDDRRADERHKDIGKVFTTIETVEGPDRLDLLCQGIANKLRKDGLDDGEIEETLHAIRAQRNRPGSQLRDFLDFLDDEALARVRLQVTMGLMDALSAQSTKPSFKAYVRRVKDCFTKFAGVKGTALVLDPSLAYGQDNVSDLAEYLQKTQFYRCLPVWAEGSAQLFETRAEPAQGVATLREGSYRFRINGNNPQTGKSAFESRLDRLQERLFVDEEVGAFVRRDIAELVFLYLVIPERTEQETGFDVVAQGARIAEWLKKEPVAATGQRRMHAQASRTRLDSNYLIADCL
jgi:hypothetical protein